MALRIKFAKANLVKYRIASRRINRRIRDKIWVFSFPLLINVSSFFFEKDSRLGLLRFAHNLLRIKFAKANLALS